APVEEDKSDVVEGEPADRLHRDRSANVHEHDPRREPPVAWKQSPFLARLRVVRESIPDDERAAFDAQMRAVARDDERLWSSPWPSDRGASSGAQGFRLAGPVARPRKPYRIVRYRSASEFMFHSEPPWCVL